MRARFARAGEDLVGRPRLYKVGPILASISARICSISGLLGDRALTVAKIFSPPSQLGAGRFGHTAFEQIGDMTYQAAGRRCRGLALSRAACRRCASKDCGLPAIRPVARKGASWRARVSRWPKESWLCMSRFSPDRHPIHPVADEFFAGFPGKIAPSRKKRNFFSFRPSGLRGC